MNGIQLAARLRAAASVAKDNETAELLRAIALVAIDVPVVVLVAALDLADVYLKDAEWGVPW